jgi:hypothetical protein
MRQPPTDIEARQIMARNTQPLILVDINEQTL